MPKRTFTTIDGNEAVAHVAYRTNEVIAIYPLDSRAPKIPIEQFLYLENRFKMFTKSKPEEAGRLLEEAQKDVQTRWRMYEYLAARKPDVNGGAPAEGPVNDK